MTEETDSAPAAEHQSAPAGDPETAVVNFPEHDLDTPGPQTAKPPPKPVEIAIASLGHEMTEEEKAEERRRWKEIQSGRHPDTGARLRYADEKTLKPMERLWLRTQRQAGLSLQNMAYLNSTHCLATDMLERQRGLSLSNYDRPYWSSPQPPIVDLNIIRSADAGWDTSLVQGQFDQLQARQSAIDAVAAALPRREYERLAETEWRRRFVEPLLDPAFVNRVTGGVSSEVMFRAGECYEKEAIRALNDQVRSAATDLMTELWKDSGRLYLRATGMEFSHNQPLMQTEAQRLLLVYGPRIVDQTGFLGEQLRNTELFAPSFTAAALERADLLARIALPSSFHSGFYGYQLENAECLRRYARAILAELKADFSNTKNPVLVWEGFAVARGYGVKVPEWVMANLEAAADAMMDIREDVEQGNPIGKEAQRVGQALGFGRKGRGGTGWFFEDRRLSRDREIYFAMTDWLNAERISRPKPKFTIAYSEVAKEFKTDPSTVRRAYRRMKGVVDTPEEDDE